MLSEVEKWDAWKERQEFEASIQFAVFKLEAESRGKIERARMLWTLEAHVMSDEDIAAEVDFPVERLRKFLGDRPVYSAEPEQC